MSNCMYIAYKVKRNELYHYGIKGMKWGIRRYQNEDGTLTAAGRKRARQEVRADNKEAYKLGKIATIYGHAAAKSMKRTIKYNNRLDKQYNKDPEGVNKKTRQIRQKLAASEITTKMLAETYAENKKLAEDHCNELIERYGKEAIKPIKYRDINMTDSKYGSKSFKTINEETSTLSEWALAGALSLTSFGVSMLLDAPISAVIIPTTTNEKARYIERSLYRENRKLSKDLNKKQPTDD